MKRLTGEQKTKTPAQSNGGYWFNKSNETDAYNFMWDMAVKENIEYSAHIFKDGVYVQKGVMRR